MSWQGLLSLGVFVLKHLFNTDDLRLLGGLWVLKQGLHGILLFLLLLCKVRGLFCDIFSTDNIFFAYGS